MSTPKRMLRLLAPASLLTAVACGQTPQATEEARGLFEGVPLFVGLTVALIVLAGGLLLGALGIERFLRTRRALEEAPPPAEEEDEEETVAGIGVGRAPVPKWLYGAYVIIPVFAFMYVMTNIAPEPPVEEPNGEPAPPVGPQTEVTIVAQGILFTVDEFTLLANSEVTVNFDNQDGGVPHDLVIWESEAAAQAGDEGARVAGTNIFTGVATQSFTFDSGPPAEYYFNCTVHPVSMFGTVHVEEG